MILLTACNDDDEKIVIEPIVNTWKLQTPNVDNNGVYTSNGPLALTWEAPASSTILDMPLPVFSNWIENLGSILLPQVLKDVTLQEDGNIVVTFSKDDVSLELKTSEPKWQVSDPKFASFKKSGSNQLLVFLNMEELMGVLTRVDASDLLPLLNLISNGIPVNYDMSSDKTSIRFYIDKSVLDKITPLLSLIREMEMPDMGGMEALLPIIIGQIEDALKVTTKVEIGLRLTKY